MLRHVVLPVLGCAILVVAASQPVSASDSVGRFRFGGSYGAAMADHEELNRTIDELEEFWAYWDVDWDDDDVGGGPVLCAFAEYLVTDRLAVGAEFMRLSGSGGYVWSHIDESGSVDVDVGYDAVANAASLYGVYRLPLGDSPVTLRFGAGAGYLLGAEFVLDFSVREEFEIWRGPAAREDTVIVCQTDVKASGSAVAFHGLVGAEWHLTDQLVLMASATYRIARVDELKVDSASTTLNGAPIDTWWVEEGETLKWRHGNGGSFSTGQGDEVGLDFGGVQLTVSVAYAF